MAGFVRIRQVESRPNLSFGRTLRLSSDRHDLIPPPLYIIRRISTSEIDLTTNYLFLQSLLITVANDKILALF